jgi:hypothetical protein
VFSGRGRYFYYPVAIIGLVLYIKAKGRVYDKQNVRICFRGLFFLQRGNGRRFFADEGWKYLGL